VYNGYRVFPGGKKRPGRNADPWPSSSAGGHESVELNLYSPYGPYSLYRASVKLYLYSSYGPYGLYRASVPVQGCTLRAGGSGDRIPVEARFSAPVQTGPGPHAASCTMGTGFFPGVKSGRGITLTPRPLLVLCCGTSTFPVGCTACTEPRCLYKGAIYLFTCLKTCP